MSAHTLITNIKDLALIFWPVPLAHQIQHFIFIKKASWESILLYNFSDTHPFNEMLSSIINVTAITAFYWRPIYTAASREYLIEILIILDI